MKLPFYYYIQPLLVLLHLLLLTDGQNIVTVKPLKVVTREVGQSVSLNCSVNRERESFSITWTEDCENTSLVQDHNQNRVTFSEDRVEVTIANLTVEDSGIYYCHMHVVKTTVKGQGTMLHVIEQPSQQATDKDHIKVTTLYSIVGFQTCAIIVLLAVLIKYCLRGTRVTKHKGNKEKEAEADQDLHYAEILRKKATPHPRTRHMEDVITYAAIKTQ